MQTHLLLTISRMFALPWCYYLSEKGWLNDFPKVTYLMRRRARISVQSNWSPHPVLLLRPALLTANLEKKQKTKKAVDLRSENLGMSICYSLAV